MARSFFQSSLIPTGNERFLKACSEWRARRIPDVISDCCQQSATFLRKPDAPSRQSSPIVVCREDIIQVVGSSTIY